jgi:hypothetical protein
MTPAQDKSTKTIYLRENADPATSTDCITIFLPASCYPGDETGAVV